MPNKTVTIGYVRGIPKDAEESRQIPFIVSTGERDRHHTVLLPENWNLSNYRKNPVVGYAHAPLGNPFLKDDPDYVIGKDINSHVEGKGRTGILAGILKFDPADVNLLAEKIFRKILLGSIRAASTSFLELGRGKWGQGEEAQGRDNETFYFAGQELIEWSVVNIPSNAAAGKRGVSVRSMGIAGITYLARSLGKDFTMTEIENMTIRDVLDLLDGRDLGIRSRNIEKVRKLIADPEAVKDQNRLIELQQIKIKSMLINNNNIK